VYDYAFINKIAYFRVEKDFILLKISVQAILFTCKHRVPYFEITQTRKFASFAHQTH
jgi:hypothetical protein